MQSFEEIQKEINTCKKCGLGDTRTHSVVGQGSLEANIIFIGEAPGKNEDLTGKPFCGKAGKIFDQLLSEANLKREDIYVTNILKCRPAKNRNPEADEIKLCTPYLVRQLEAIKPKIICCLGNFSIAFIMKKFNLADKIQVVSKIHGRVFIPPSAFSVKVLPLYHPASAIYNPGMFDVLKEDFRMLKNIPF